MNNVAESFTQITMNLIPTLIWDSQKKCNCHFITGAQTLRKTNFQLLGWIISVGRGHRIVFGLVSNNGWAWRRKSSFWETSENTGRLGGFHQRCTSTNPFPSARTRHVEGFGTSVESWPWDFQTRAVPETKLESVQEASESVSSSNMWIRERSSSFQGEH